MSIQLLSESFTFDHFTYRVLLRHGHWVLLSQDKPRHPTTFEVVHLHVRPAARIFGKDYPDREVMPASEEWGTRGWTLVDRDTAITRFKEKSGFN